MKLVENLRGLSKGRILALGLLLIALLGAVDYLTPFELTLFMFYTGPILLVAWYGTRRDAIFLAIICTAVWWLANLQSQPFTAQSFAWAAFNRLVLLVLIAIGGAAMATKGEALRSRLAALERSRELEEEILRVSEREKMRIGQDLHDGLCQNLAAIDCAVACLKLDLEEKSAPEAEAAAFIQSQLNRAVIEARDLARGIFPVNIGEEGFEAALEELVATTNRLRQLRVNLQFHGEVKIREPQAAMHLYRIAQEALSNASKHARATDVSITLQPAEESLELRVADNGIGFEPKEKLQGGLGLHTMDYRARVLGGELEVSRGRENGTVVLCTVPFSSGVVSLR